MHAIFCIGDDGCTVLLINADIYLKSYAVLFFHPSVSYHNVNFSCKIEVTSSSDFVTVDFSALLFTITTKYFKNY
jgi:hypothetical protein